MAINVKDKLVTVESLGIAYSAEQDAREEADQALSTRIDNIVAPEGDPSLAEVADARTSGSTTYNNLKARLDADKAEIGTDIDELKADLDDLDDNVEDINSTLFSSKSESGELTKIVVSDTSETAFNIVSTITNRNSAIVRVSGKNLFDLTNDFYQNKNIGTADPSTGTILATNTYSYVVHVGVRMFLPQGDYCCSCSFKSEYVISVYSGNTYVATAIPKSALNGHFSIANSGVYYIRMTVPANETIQIVGFQLEIGTTPSEFEAFSGIKYTQQFSDIVASGSYNWTTGVLTVDGSTEMYIARQISGAVGINYVLSESGQIEVNWGQDVNVVTEVEFAQEKAKLNPLYGKTIIWDGDSICAGDAFDDVHSGWSGRIAENNRMIYHNYARGGGTITENVVDSGGNTKHSVSANIETMYAAFPNADYVIIEGGTNDADLLGNVIGGTIPERFGSFSMSDYSGNYDEDTFCGALESVFYRLINYWKGKKLAYIVPHKMGIANSGFDFEHSNKRAYFKTAFEICDKWGIPYLNLWDGCYINPLLTTIYDRTKTTQENIDAGSFLADGQHLTASGYDFETPIIESWLKTL